MQLVDLHDLVGLGERRVEIAPLVGAVPHQIAAGVLVDRGSAVVLGSARVGDRVERLVFDLDQLRGVACALARFGHHGDDRLTDVAHLADGEGVVLEVRARDGRDLEERIGERGHLFAGQRAVDPRQLLRLRHVDRRDVGVRIRRAHEVDEAHPVPLDVVDEDALPLHEPAVLLARDVLALPLLGRRLDLGGLGRGGRRRRRHSDAALTASKMFQ